SATLAAVSTDTVTLLSDVEMRSTDMPCSRKQSKASARNPTSCHISIDSMESKVMPLRCDTAFRRGMSSSDALETTLPCHSGCIVHFRYSGIPDLRSGEILRG